MELGLKAGVSGVYSFHPCSAEGTSRSTMSQIMKSVLVHLEVLVYSGNTTTCCNSFKIDTLQGTNISPKNGILKMISFSPGGIC